MKSRKSIVSKMEIFYREVEPKRKGLKTRLQTDQEFKQRKIYELNKKYIVGMFLMVVRGGKAFAAEQKLRKLKKEYLDLRPTRKKSQNE